MDRKKRNSIIFEGYAGLHRFNFIQSVAGLTENQRITHFDSSKPSFGIGFRFRKYTSPAPYRWYLGTLMGLKNYNYVSIEGVCAGPPENAEQICPINSRNLNISSQRVSFGFETGYNVLFDNGLNIELNATASVVTFDNERSRSFDFAPDPIPGFGRTSNPRTRYREVIADPGDQYDKSTFLSTSLSLLIGFDVRQKSKRTSLSSE